MMNDLKPLLKILLVAVVGAGFPDGVDVHRDICSSLSSDVSRLLGVSSAVPIETTIYDVFSGKPCTRFLTDYEVEKNYILLKVFYIILLFAVIISWLCPLLIMVEIFA